MKGIFQLLVMGVFLATLLFSASVRADEASVTILKIGDLDAVAEEKPVVSKPMPITVSGEFKNLGDGSLYILEIGEWEDNVYHIQPLPTVNKEDGTFTASIWFGTDEGKGHHNHFSVFAIITAEELKLEDGDHPINEIPEYIAISPAVTVYRLDKDAEEESEEEAPKAE